jgi:catechol 2,3-dioxygenase-like lactoylglutathione lyase family enzyme
MFSHIMVGVSDFPRAMAFYTPVLQALGVQFRFLEEDRPWAGWQSSPDPRPLFLIGRPYNQAHDYGAYFRDPDGNKLCVACHGVG